MPVVYVNYNVWKVGGTRKSPGPKYSTTGTKYPSEPEGPFSFMLTSYLGNPPQPLAFVSVSGSANGNYVITNYPNPIYVPSPSVPPPSFANPPLQADIFQTANAGKTDLHISAWYLPVGPGGVEGAYIDSFNVDAGDFFYDPNIPNDFVSVSPDQGLTAAANNLGWVPTTSAETITSNAAILNVPFLNWTVMYSGGNGAKAVVNGKNLSVSAHSTDAAIGFFGHQNRQFINLADIYALLWHRLYPGEAVDGPPPGDPGPGMAQAAKQLRVLIAVQDSINLVAESARSVVQAQAAKSIQTITNAINQASHKGIGR